MPLACYNISLPYCSGMDYVENPEHMKSFYYVMAAGNVPIYAHDMRNTERWLKKVRRDGRIEWNG